MKIIYILKKGFQYFPPCLAQVLSLNDLGVNLVVYHGKNTPQINALFDQRNIEHYTFESDKQSKSRFDMAKNFFFMRKEIRRLQKQISYDDFIWLGNAETAIAMEPNDLRKRKFLLSILELYDVGNYIEKKLATIINDAKFVIACEKHRAMIMYGRYNLKEIPFVIPNKPYEYNDAILQDEYLQRKMHSFENKIIVLYQGIISKDRPLDKVAEALNKINDDNVYFFVLGKSNPIVEQEIKKIYDRTVFWGFIPSPSHLIITSKCHIGVANYDMSCLNNIFCAPNKIYEYSKYGLPLLVSQNAGLTETVGLAGAAECVDFNNIDQISCGIKKMLQSYATYSENARKFYRSTDLLTLYKKVLSKIEENT